VGEGAHPHSLMRLRPLDRLSSLRTKLGAVIVFAVAVTILIMYVAVGFAFRKSEQYRQFRELLIRTKAVAALGFNRQGVPSAALVRALHETNVPLLLVNGDGVALVGELPVPAGSVTRVLAGNVPFDSGKIGDLEYIGVPIVRGGVVGGIYLSHKIESGGIIAAIRATASFVRTVWWQLLIAGAIAAFIALGLARVLARGLTQPLRDMAQAASRLSRGDYRQPVEVRSRDEVGQLAEAFNRMAGELEGVERLRRDLVANVSHELKTPIAAIRARLENLLDGIEQPNPALLASMVQQSERLSRLVDQLLDLSKFESGDVPLNLEPVLLPALVDRVGAEVGAARSDRSVELRNEIPVAFPAVLADRERLHQVLFNLLDNAYRFSPEGSIVSVYATRNGDAGEVVVEDRGPGIAREHLPLIFERFYRVDPSRSREDGGTGIGLAIARSVVEAHGGRIWAESAVGQGSRFVFRIPLATAAIDGRERRVVPTPVTVGTKGDG
jgi:signal transduction histidine kinase